MENVAQDLMGELAPDAPADAIHDRSLEALAVALLISDDGRAAENNSGQNKGIRISSSHHRFRFPPRRAAIDAGVDEHPPQTRDRIAAPRPNAQ